MVIFALLRIPFDLSIFDVAEISLPLITQRDFHSRSTNCIFRYLRWCCCLTSDIKECTEVIQDTGVSFRTSDINDLKDKLQMLCEDSKIVVEYRTKAFDRAINDFNWDTVVEQTLEIYQKDTSL